MLTFHNTCSIFSVTSFMWMRFIFLFYEQLKYKKVLALRDQKICTFTKEEFLNPNSMIVGFTSAMWHIGREYIWGKHSNNHCACMKVNTQAAFLFEIWNKCNQNYIPTEHKFTVCTGYLASYNLANKEVAIGTIQIEYKNGFVSQC